MVCAIQSEWIFQQCVTWNIRDAFARVDKMIQENFLPRLFFRKTKTLSPIVGNISTITIKVDVLGLLNLVTLSK